MNPMIKIRDAPIKKCKNSDLWGNKIPLNSLIFLSQLQNILELEKLHEKANLITQAQGSEYTISIEDFNVLLQRTKRWVDEIKKIIETENDSKIKKNLMQKISLFDIPDKLDTNMLNKLDQQQKDGIKMLREYLNENKNVSADLIQNKIFKKRSKGYNSLSKPNKIKLRPKTKKGLYKIFRGMQIKIQIG